MARPKPINEKVCGICKEPVSLERYPKHNKAYCLPCLAIYNRFLYKSKGYKQRILRSNMANRHSNIEFTKEHLRHHPCVDCGNPDFRVLQFDHRDSEQKIMNVYKMAARAFSRDKLIAEMAKCDIRCANCHFIRHYEERKINGWRGATTPSDFR